MQSRYYSLLTVPEYDGYIKDTIKLIRSLVIKDISAAKQMNAYLSTMHVSIDDLDESSWKYYINLSGEYFITSYNSVVNDEIMYFTTIETQEKVEFTKENLDHYPESHRYFKRMDDIYFNILKDYPHQALLIHGIIWPIDITKAIQARDNEILSYEESFISPNELNLIPKLQAFIDNWVSRWDNTGFNLSDSLYRAATTSTLYNSLVLGLLAIRLENMRTGQAHEFHIDSYLSSFYDLRPVLPRLYYDQKLWLYLNLLDIERHNGSTDALLYMHNNIGKPYGAKLKKFNFSQRLQPLLDVGNDTTLDPRDFDLRKITSVYPQEVDTDNISSFDSPITPSRYIEDVKNLGTLNLNYLDRDTHELKYLNAKTIAVKDRSHVLQVIIRNNALYRTIDIYKERLNYLFYLNQEHQYIEHINIIDPNLGFHATNLRVQDVLPLLVYLANLLAKNPNSIQFPDEDVIPKLYVHNILNTTEDNILRSPITEKYEYLRVYPDKILDTPIQASSGLPVPTLIDGVDHFVQFVDDVAMFKYRHQLLWHFEPDTEGKAEISNMIDKLYHSYEISLSDYDRWSDYFTNVFNYRFDQKIDLHQNIFSIRNLYGYILKELTGIDIDNPYIGGLGSGYYDVLQRVLSYTTSLYNKSAYEQYIQPIEYVELDIDLGMQITYPLYQPTCDETMNLIFNKLIDIDATITLREEIVDYVIEKDINTSFDVGVETDYLEEDIYVGIGCYGTDHIELKNYVSSPQMYMINADTEGIVGELTTL